MFEGLITQPHDAVQLVMGVALALMGVSHTVQPGMWRDFFNRLHSLGTSGVVIRTFALELWPALLIVLFHQVWRGPGIVLTIYGWLLASKVVLSLLRPQLGLRSLAQADRVSNRGWVIGGLVLIAVAATCFWALLV